MLPLDAYRGLLTCDRAFEDDKRGSTAVVTPTQLVFPIPNGRVVAEAARRTQCHAVDDTGVSGNGVLATTGLSGGMAKLMCARFHEYASRDGAT